VTKKRKTVWEWEKGWWCHTYNYTYPKYAVFGRKTSVCLFKCHTYWI